VKEGQRRAERVAFCAVACPHDLVVIAGLLACRGASGVGYLCGWVAPDAGDQVGDVGWGLQERPDVAGAGEEDQGPAGEVAGGGAGVAGGLHSGRGRHSRTADDHPPLGFHLHHMPAPHRLASGRIRECLTRPR
jgi:hypothetical protein